MVAVFNKELLSWYLITLKLREAVESGVATTSTTTPAIEFPEQTQHLLQKQQQQQSESLQIVIRNDGEKCEEVENPPDSEWVISIKEKLEQASQDDAASSWAKLCIYRVPHYLREGDDKAYVPQIVSVGPYHHGKRRLRQMDRHKWRALQHVLKRTNHNINLYLDAVKELEERARACYEGPSITSLGSNEFVEMMVIDGTFVIELFRGAAEGFKQLDEPLTKSYRSKLESSLGYATTFDPLSDQGGLHCLDVFRRSLLQTGPQLEPRIWIKRWSHNRVADKRRQQLIHCVTELKEAGIKFKKRKTDRFWDIKFKNGILYIPRLLIHDGTKSLFLNLIAFEQCHLDCGNGITSYVVFMDNLINSDQDVGHLHYHGIIEHWLGSDAEVADLFNRLCQEVVFDINDSYLSHLTEDVNRYYDHKWNAWCASLRHNYFSNPWAIISLVAAELLSWYLIIVKLGEAVESGVATTSTTSPTIEFPEQTQHSLQKQQQEPSESLQIVIRNYGENCEEVDNPPDSEWAISIKEKLEQASQDDAASSWAKLCIYRVPHYPREGDDKAYAPQIVSVGPYHHGKRRLRQMDCHKWRALQHVLKLTNHDINLYLDAVKELEERARNPSQKGLVAKLVLQFFDLLMPTNEPLTKSYRSKLES
ncbi:upf0481 protein [Quercus suber]|uniref:Upf0481 protein n=1 Tax=Quercus suber TaxID=58331 RepID=A0AAW0JZY3_QUESU